MESFGKKANYFVSYPATLTFNSKMTSELYSVQKKIF